MKRSDDSAETDRPASKVGDASADEPEETANDWAGGWSGEGDGASDEAVAGDSTLESKKDKADERIQRIDELNKFNWLRHGDRTGLAGSDQSYEKRAVTWLIIGSLLLFAPLVGIAVVQQDFLKEASERSDGVEREQLTAPDESEPGQRHQLPEREIETHDERRGESPQEPSGEEENDDGAESDDGELLSPHEQRRRQHVPR